MAPKRREGGHRVYRNTKSWDDMAKMCVADLFKGRGTITDSSDYGDRIFCTDSKYPGYEFIIRTWSWQPVGEGSLEKGQDIILDSYTIYPQKIERLRCPEVGIPK
jgi:hypothetical protein